MNSEIFKLACDYYEEQNTSQTPEFLTPHPSPKKSLKSFLVNLSETVQLSGISQQEILLNISRKRRLNRPLVGIASNMLFGKTSPAPSKPSNVSMTFVSRTKELPMTWQIAKGILIPKKKEIKIGKDLRPIQPNIYKIFSSVLRSKIHDFAKDNKIWSDEQ